MPCPTDAELADFLADRLSPARDGELEQHLNSCPQCLAKVAETPTDPRFLDAIRHTPVSGKGPPAELIDRLEKLYTLASTGGFDHSDAPVNPADFVGPPAWVAHYRILHQLGAGGMGVVYQAEDSHLRRQVALKVLWPWAARDPRARRRFLHEARAVAALKHDHIVTIFQVGEAPTDDGAGTHLFLAMELLEGEGLDHWMLRHSHPPLSTAVRIVREAATGLAAAHDRGVIHRDVKPGNLWLEVRGRRDESTPDTTSPLLTDTRVKLLDFGLAIEADEVDGDTLVGTPAYMAPEQALRAATDSRTDIFGLGCVLYELCTGSRPFPDRDRRNLGYTLPVPPRDRNPEIPPDLADLIAWMLAEAPADRPTSATEVERSLTAIEQTLAESVAAERPSDTVAIPQPPTTRRRRWWLPAAVLGVVIAGGAWLVISRLKPTEPPPASPTLQPAGAESETELVRNVIEQLKSRNPQFDGSVSIQMDGGKVVHIGIPADVVSDIGPVKALSHLRYFRAVGKERGSGRLTDLSPLQGKPIERIECWHNPGIRDFGPLRGMPLTHLDADGVGIGALDDLAGMPLEFLAIDRTMVRDLSPIRTMPRLREVRFIGCDVTSFAPLADTRVTNVRCDVRPGPNEATLRSHPTIQFINGQTRDQFWITHNLKSPSTIQGDSDQNK